MSKETIDLSGGMIRKKPTHEAGEITGWSQDDGLPIVKRKSAASTTQPQTSSDNAPAKPAAKPETQAEKPEKAASPEPKQDAEPAKPAALAKGSAVTMPDGSTGKISYMDSQLKIARVSKDKGGSSTHPLSKLKAADSPEAKETDVPAGHTFVKAHLRPLPEKTK